QNRLTNPQAVVKDIKFSLLSVGCDPIVPPTCITKQLLRYSLTLEMTQKGSGGTSEARQPTLTIQEGLPLGLVNEATTILKIDTTFLPDANANGPYIASVVASGGMPDYHWSELTGNWPPGSQWNINPNTGVISGTPNSQQAAGNTYLINVKVTDSDNPASFVTRALSIKVLDNLITISTASPLPNATEGSQYTLQMAATIRPSNGTCGSCVWSLDSGTLPSGITLDSTGKISGKPDAGSAGTYSPIIRAIDGSHPTNYITQAFQLTVLPASGGQTLTITTTSLPGGTVSTPYSQAITATGGTTPYTWSLFSGTLPPGLILTSGTPSATLSGNPTLAGTYNFVLKVAENGRGTDTQDFVIIILGGGMPGAT
ncbi:MAG: putative Ig domain-containing protein, partial [Candidatus Berkelbacteria bacterium]|nr:putative Ig domain-containing protein [Candidatus Berkelbacteria bacterium]